MSSAERQPLPPLAVPIVLALIPLGYLVWTCHRLHVDVPIGDQWELVERFDKLDAGTLTLHDVWRQHNEHRPMFPILYMLALGRATGWNTGAEIASSFAMALVTFALFASTAGRFQGRLRWLLPLGSLLFFSTVQWENWIQGWQLGVFMCVMSSALGFRLLSQPDPAGVRLATALAAGVVATYAFGSGMAYWFAGLLPIALASRPSRARVIRAVAWVLVGGLTIASYMYGYHGNPDAIRANFASLLAFATFVAYIPRYLGGPVGAVHGAVALLAGVAVLSAYVWLVIRLWPRRSEPSVLFPAAWGLHTIGIAAITALGRAYEDMPTASRYTTMAIPLWLCVMLLAGLADVRRPAIAGWIASHRAAAAGVVGAFCLSVILSGVRPLFWAQVHHDIRANALLPLIRGDELPLLGRLYVNDGEEVMRRREVLKRLRLSVFRPGRYTP